MSVPQNILDQLGVVDADDEALVGLLDAAQASQVALSKAQQEADAAVGNLTAGQTKLTTDKQALFDLINAQYGPTGPPTPPPPPPPDTVPGGGDAMASLRRRG